MYIYDKDSSNLFVWKKQKFPYYIPFWKNFLVPYDLKKKYFTKSIEYSFDWTVPASEIHRTTGKKRTPAFFRMYNNAF